MDIIKNISVLGDSILKGVVWDELAGKYKFLKESAASLFGTTNSIAIHNYSKFGCTTIKALQNLPALLGRGETSNIILLELGGNDCDYNWEEVCQNPQRAHIPKVVLEDFKINIKNIVEQILSAGKRPVIMSLPPIDADRYFDWVTQHCKEKAQNLMSFLGDKNLIYRHQELYAHALEAVANQYKLRIVPVREALLGIHKYSDYLCLDGIHLNARGQAFLKQIFDTAYLKYQNGTL